MKKMFYIILILQLLISSYLMYGQCTYNKKSSIISPQEALLGSWTSLAKDSKMDFYKNGDVYAAKLTAGWGNSMYEADGKTLKKDSKNRNINLKDRNLLNMEFISGLTYLDGQYINGNLYSPQIGRTLLCKLKIRDNKLIIRMYVGWSLIGVTKQFTKDEVK